MATPEMKAGDRTLSRAAGMVADGQGRLRPALRDDVGHDRRLPESKWQGQGGRPSSACTRPGPRSRTASSAPSTEFEAALTSTERDNINTDQPQSANMNKNHSRLDGVKQY